MRIGLPRALMLYRYSPFLRTFMEECGFEVYSSPPTNLKILRSGTAVCIDDICVAVKVFFGHVACMAEEVDAILIPRMVSVEKSKHPTFTCPKLIATPDRIRHSFPRLPTLLEFTVDLQKAPWWWGCVRLGKRLRVPMWRIARAYIAAVLEHKRYERLLHAGLFPDDAMARLEGNGSSGLPSYLHEGDISVAIVGHPYLLGDPLLNQRLVHWLQASGARVYGSTMLNGEDVEKEIAHLLPLSWSYERELLEAAAYFLNRRDVDGVIYLTSFGCGPDSIMMEIVRRELRKEGDHPLLELVLDEHSVESGIRTRAEAFVDLLRHQKSKAG
jgi:predicted nucleotide-binding protein (sugar kinase/HSP70/actin superfamily)